MKGFNLFATDYYLPPECDVLEWGGEPGLEYPVRTECGNTKYLYRPYVYIPILLVITLIFVLLVHKIRNNKKSNYS